jgi:hypothetical protein
MAYVVMIIVLSAPALLAFAALRQIAEEQPRPAPAPLKREPFAPTARLPQD